MKDKKVKAKDFYTGSWIEGSFIFKQDDGEEYWCIADEPISIGLAGDIVSAWWRIDENTICYETGLEIDGKRVYENDIFHDGDEDLCVVEWNNETASYVFSCYGIPGRLMEYGWDETAGDIDVNDTLSVVDFYDFSNFKRVGNMHDFESIETVYQKVSSELKELETQAAKKYMDEHFQEEERDI